MRQAGIVLEVRGGEAVVQIEACEQSGQCCACAALGGENRSLQARTSLPVQVGERVVVDVPTSNTPLRALLVFALPLAGLAGGVALGQLWRPPGLGPGAASLVLGLAAWAALFALGALIDWRASRKRMCEPTIVASLATGHPSSADRQ